MALALQIHRRRVALLLAAGLCALSVATAGCLYTGRINSKPSVMIFVPQGPLQRGQSVTIGAIGSDDDGDVLSYAWYVVPGDCTTPLDARALPVSRTYPPFVYQLPRDEQSTACVWVTVTDPDGASAIAGGVISAGNRPPVATIDVQQPATNGFGTYDLYSVFRLGGGHSSDPDGDAIVSRTWTLVSAPPVPTLALVPCSPTPPDDQVVCLDASSFPGLYVVELTVNDGFADSAPAEVMLTVAPDHPLCVALTDPMMGTTPIVWDPSEDKDFTVDNVIDDGAPFPPSMEGGEHYAPTFAWSLRRNGGAWQDLVGFDALNKVTLPGGSFLSGDDVDVRVVVSDGVANHPVALCDPSCPAGCIDTVTWTVEYR
jgi:hypothetical protein